MFLLNFHCSWSKYQYKEQNMSLKETLYLVVYDAAKVGELIKKL